MVLGFPSRSWPSCKQLATQEASLSILQHYSQLYSQTRCPEQLGVMVQELSRLGRLPGLPGPILQERRQITEMRRPRGIHGSPKGLFIPKDLVGEVITSRAPAGRNRGCGW